MCGTRQKMIKFPWLKKKRGDEPIQADDNATRLADDHERAAKITVVNMNARSLLNKVEALESTLLEFEPHIATITETWLNPQILDSEIVPPNYVMLRKDRTSRGGGVAILLMQGIPYVLLSEVK